MNASTKTIITNNSYLKKQITQYFKKYEIKDDINIKKFKYRIQV